jgi:nitric oxide synthase oxygenase domain/subunit
MAVLTETHERVHVDHQHMTSPNGSSLDAQVLPPVSMNGATTVTVEADRIAWKGNGDRVQVRLQQGSDEANWFEVTPTGANVLTLTPVVDKVTPVFNNVGMAWARVVLMMDSTGTPGAGDGAIVKAVITTS